MFRVGEILKKYRSGKLPKAFKVIPSLTNWEEVSFDSIAGGYYYILARTRYPVPPYLVSCEPEKKIKLEK